MLKWGTKNETISFVSILIILAISICFLAACGKDKTDNMNATNADASSVGSEYANDNDSSNTDASDDLENSDNNDANGLDEGQYAYITLDKSVGLKKYMGIEYEPAETEATEAEINKSMDDTLVYFQSFMDIEELTDDIISEFYEDYNTVEELYNAHAEIISQNKLAIAHTINQEQVLSKLVENSDIFVDLTEEAAECYTTLMIHYNALAVASAMTLEEYMNEVLYPGVSDWNKKLAEDAAELTCRHRILLAIAEAENITISDADYESLVENYMKYYGYDNRELFEAEFTKEHIILNMIEDSALELVMNKAVPVK